MRFLLTGTQDSINRTFTADGAFRAGTAALNLNRGTYLPDDVAWGLTESSSTVVVLNSAPDAQDVIFLEAEPFTLVAGSATDPGYRGIQEVEYRATGQVLTCWPDISGVQVDPSSPTVIVLKDGQDETAPQVTSTAATEDSVTHQLSKTIDVSDTSAWPLGTRGRAKWTWTYGGRTYTATTTFEVVRQPLVYNVPVTEEDILKGHQAVAEALVQSGETATTVAQKYIMQAWADVLQWVRSKGKRPALTTGKEGFERVAYYRTLVLLYRAYRETRDDTWQIALTTVEKEYENAKAECVLEYRESDATSAVTQRGFQQPQLLVGNDLAADPFVVFPFGARRLT